MKRKVFLFISLFLIFIFIFKINIKAEEYQTLPNEYFQVNLGNDSMLEEDGLKLISGSVDWDKEGRYILIYSDYGDNLYKKEVIILLNTNDQYIIETVNSQEISFEDIENVVDIFYVNNNSYYVVSNYQIEDPTYYDQEKICVTYFENRLCKWMYTYYKYSRYQSGIVVNDNLVISGLVYNHDNDSINTIVLFEITKDRQIIKSREIASNLSCASFGLYYFDNFIFMITATSGNSGDYENIKYNNNYELVILRLSYDSFKILSSKLESEISDFKVVDTSFYNGRITVNLSLNNDKTIDGVINTNVILEYNDDLNKVNSYYYSLKDKEYLGYQVLEKDICFYSIDHLVNKNCVKIQYLNSGVYEKNIVLDRQNIYNINDINIVYVANNSMYVCLKYKSLNENYFIGYAKIDSENGVKYFTMNTQKINILKCKSNDFIINTYIKDGKLYYDKIMITEIYKLNFEYPKYINEKTSVIVNCIHTRETQYIDNTNYNVFGEYKNIIITKDHFDNKYHFNEKVDVIFQTNIQNNELYQTGFKLSFNGLGTLNGIEINSEYTINDIGNYLLLIEGANSQKKTFNFEIKDLTISSEERKIDNFEISSINYYPKYYNDESYIKQNINIEYTKSNKNLIPIALSILAFGILSFVLVRKKI